MSEIKTLNGYSLADTKAREDIAALTEEMDGLSEDIKVVESTKHLFEDVNLLEGVEWEIGTIDQYTNGLPDQDSTTRIRTKGFISIAGVGAITFSAADGYKYVVDYADDNGNVVNVNKHGTWQTGSATYSSFGTATKIRMLVADVSNGSASIDYAAHVTAESINKLDSAIGKKVRRKVDTVFSAKIAAKNAYFESDGNNGIYIRIPGDMYIRGESHITFNFDKVFADKLVTSPNGVENCVFIPHNNSLVFSPASNSLSIENSLSGGENVTIFAVAVGRHYDEADGVVSGIGQWYYLEHLIATHSADNLPAYWESEIIATIPTAQQKAMSYGRDGESFIFVTDLHWHENVGYSPVITKTLIEKLGVNRVILGGDYIHNGGKEEMALLVSDCLSKYRALGCDLLPMFGNHDGNEINSNNDETLYFGKAGSYALINNHLRDVNYGGYCYYAYDNSTTGTRYIFLDTGLERTALSEEQQTWFESTLESTPAGYKVFIFAHIIYQPSTWVKPFTDTLTRTGFMNTICTLADTFNESNTDREVVAIIGGHIHLDMSYTTSGGIPIILCDCDARKTFSDSGDAPGTINEQCVSLFNVDYTARKIYMTRVGRGNDLEFAY